MVRGWQRWAVCAGAETEVFYPVLNGRGRRAVRADPDAPVWAQAKALCAVCPVVASCLEAVERIEADEPYAAEGFRGGLTPGEREVRRRQIRARRRQERPTDAAGSTRGATQVVH